MNNLISLGVTESAIEDSAYEGHIVKSRKSCVKGGEPNALILGLMGEATNALRMPLGVFGVKASDSPALDVLMLLEVVPLRFLPGRCNKEGTPFKGHPSPQAYPRTASIDWRVRSSMLPFVNVAQQTERLMGLSSCMRLDLQPLPDRCRAKSAAVRGCVASCYLRWD